VDQSRLYLQFPGSRQCESNNGIPDRIGLELPIRDIPAEGVHHEFLAPDYVSDGCRLCPAAVGYGCPVESEQYLARLRVGSVKLAIALAENTKSPATDIPDFAGCATLTFQTTFPVLESVAPKIPKSVTPGMTSSKDEPRNVPPASGPTLSGDV
jgi:hypothetical protein